MSQKSSHPKEVSLNVELQSGVFSPSFIAHLFSLVERTRDAEDETFNYSLIRLLIALNEQYMVSILPPPSPHHNHRGLPPPILPTMVGHAKQEMEGNLVLEVLKRTAGENKTFGENIIFILNRSSMSFHPHIHKLMIDLTDPGQQMEVLIRSACRF